MFNFLWIFYYQYMEAVKFYWLLTNNFMVDFMAETFNFVQVTRWILSEIYDRLSQNCFSYMSGRQKGDIITQPQINLIFWKK